MEYPRTIYFAGVLVVSLGIMTFICMSATYFNLENNMARFYRECNFADHYFQVASAPEQIIDQIAAVPVLQQ
jgi:hypothetical protein